MQPYNSYMMALAAQFTQTNNNQQPQQQQPVPPAPPHQNVIMMMMNQMSPMQMNAHFGLKPPPPPSNGPANGISGPGPGQPPMHHHQNQHHQQQQQSHHQHYQPYHNHHHHQPFYQAISPSINSNPQQPQMQQKQQITTHIRKKSCYNCGSMNHTAVECTEPTIESSMQQSNQFRLNFKPTLNPTTSLNNNSESSSAANSEELKQHH
jgi:hypothetical protein